MYVIRVKGSAFSHTLYIVHVITVINCALLFLIQVYVDEDVDDPKIWQRRLSGHFAGLFPRSLSFSSTENEAKKRKAQPKGWNTFTVLVLFMFCLQHLSIHLFGHMCNVHFNNCFSWIK